MNNSFIKFANQALREGQYDNAISFYKKAINLDPRLEKVLDFNMRFCRRMKSQYSTSLKIEITENLVSRKILLRLETVGLTLATGWALEEDGSNEPIFLISYLNDYPLYIADTYKVRNDVKKVYGGDGCCGYSIELNEYLDFNGNAVISVEPLNATLAKNNKREQHEKIIPKFLAGEHFSDVNDRAKFLVKSNLYSQSGNNIEEISLARVSIIILNLNGLAVLENCLNSLFHFVKNIFEIIVVDHCSTDGSIEYLKSIKDSRLVLILREKNYSFSESNNLAAKQAKGDYLIFMNNDIILENDIVSSMVNSIGYSSFGVLGVKLWDFPQSLDINLVKKLKVVQHIGVHFKDCNRTNYIEAYESRLGTYFDGELNGIYETPAVTAAMMIVSACDFNKIGGFNEKYFYGQEDVDFCLKYLKSGLGKIGVMLDNGVYHARGLSRRVLSSSSASYINNNRVILQQEQSAWFRRKIRADRLNKFGYWNPKPYAIAMIVSEISFDTDKADYFTARELGDAIEEDKRIVVGYFSADEKDIDLNGYDAVIVFIDNFNILKLKKLSPEVLIIGWARNWFDRWCDRHWISAYDLIFASSDYAKRYMEERLQRRVGVMRIAASTSCINIEKLKSNEEYESDYTFTGSYFGSHREITEFLKPKELPYKFNLYGHNWESHNLFSQYTKGAVSYNNIPNIYASTKLVIDDANIATKDWGALNCRIYDSLAAGVLCVTNNSIGVSEIFEDDYPVYSDNLSLHQHIKKFIDDDLTRGQIAKKYQNIVISDHTYSSRAKQLINEIDLHNKKIKLSIKISAPELSKVKPWGDYYFAISIAKHFEKNGYSVRIDCMDQWYSTRAMADDVVISLRGLDRYEPRADQLNLLWVISHPERVSVAEIKNFQHVYVASQYFAEKLKEFTNLSIIESLPQATDFSMSELDEDRLLDTPAHEILFVGNSRGKFRNVVKWCVEKNYPIAIYGSGWEGFIDKKFIVSEFVENQNIPYLYNKAGVVLNDHWDDMRELGFLSNRVWDVIGSGGIILSDYVYGIDAIDHPRLYSYNDREDFYNKLDQILSSKKCTREDNTIFNSIYFSDRVEVIHRYVSSVIN